MQSYQEAGKIKLSRCIGSKSAENVTYPFKLALGQVFNHQKQNNFHPTPNETPNFMLLQEAQTSELFRCNLERRQL